MWRCALVVVVASVTAWRVSGAAEDWKERLMKEAPKAWDDYRKKLAGFNQYEVLRTFSNSSGTASSARSKVKRNRTHDRFVSEFFVDSNRLGKNISLRLLRRDLACELFKNVESGPWLVRELDWDVEEKLEQYWEWLGIGKRWELIEPTLELPAAGFTSISDVITDPTVAIEACGPSSRDKNQVVLVLKSTRSELLPAREARSIGDRIRRMVIELDPQRHWIVLRGEVLEETIEDKSEDLFYVEVKEIEGVALPSKYVRQFKVVTKSTNKTLSGIETREYRFVRDSPPDEEFELTYYGIPAAIAARPAGGPKTWQWLALAGAVLLAVGVGIYWWLGRRQAAASR